ncbi:hypothetical protein PoB_007370900 [Plakobranchus ocellatus]|uniref:Uncharacterized protein n=1 Tax=Plakobranchus ocellatus TaxID=259542 RepID=A0AAV4DT76_9GAST|nr:hypothetical protein PoB_007370900 [Plakobranchus ocellatus]
MIKVDLQTASLPFLNPSGLLFHSRPYGFYSSEPFAPLRAIDAPECIRCDPVRPNNDKICGRRVQYVGSKITVLQPAKIDDDDHDNDGDNDDAFILSRTQQAPPPSHAEWRCAELATQAETRSIVYRDGVKRQQDFFSVLFFSIHHGMQKLCRGAFISMLGHFSRQSPVVSRTCAVDSRHGRRVCLRQSQRLGGSAKGDHSHLEVTGQHCRHIGQLKTYALCSS